MSFAGATVFYEGLGDVMVDIDYKCGAWDAPAVDFRVILC